MEKLVKSDDVAAANMHFTIPEIFQELLQLHFNVENRKKDILKESTA